MRTWELTKATSVERVVKQQLWEFEQHTRYLFHHTPTFPCRQLKYIISIKVIHYPCRNPRMSIKSIDHHPLSSDPPSVMLWCV